MPSLRSFVAHLDHVELLRSLLERHRLELHSEEKAGDTALIVSGINRAIAEARVGTRTEFERDLERIHRLASETGEVANGSATLHDELRNLKSSHARSLWVFLNDSLGFRRAEELHYAGERRRGRDWDAFHVLSDRDPLRDDAAITAFADAFRKEFDTNNVHIDIYDRLGADLTTGTKAADGTPQLVQFTIFREDRSNTENVFVGTELRTEHRRRVVEASVTYEPATGLIECVASRRDAREQIVQLVATTLLGCPPDLQPVKASLYTLEALRQRVAFVTEPSEGINMVRVAMMRLEPFDTAGQKITVEVAPSSDDDIWSTVEQRLGAGALESDYQITQAKLVVSYNPKDGGKMRSLPLVITPPHRSTIREHLEVEQALTSKCLPRWGLVAA